MIMTDVVKDNPHWKRNRVYCSVPQCSTYGSMGFPLHFFPKDNELCQKWQTVLKIGKPISRYMRVCGKHFLPSDYIITRPVVGNLCNKRLKKISVPSVNLPVTTRETKSSPKKGRPGSGGRHLERKEQPGAYAKVCSCHFPNGDKSLGPVLYEHNKSKSFASSTPASSIESSFPTKTEVRQQWIVKCQRADTFNANNAYVCSKHFDETDFERDFRNELLGLTPKRFLKSGVIPHLNISLDAVTSGRDIPPGPHSMICNCHFLDGKKENGPTLFDYVIRKRMKEESRYGNSSTGEGHLHSEKSSKSKRSQSRLPEISFKSSQFEDAEESETKNLDKTLQTEVKAQTLEDHAILTGLQLADWLKEESRVFFNFVAEEFLSINNQEIRNQLKRDIQKRILESLEKDALLTPNS